MFGRMGRERWVECPAVEGGGSVTQPREGSKCASAGASRVNPYTGMEGKVRWWWEMCAKKSVGRCGGAG